MPAPTGSPAAPHPPWHHWRHLTKLDPDRDLPDRHLDLVRSSGTDALVVGGTQGITAAKVQSLLARVTGLGIPVALEVSTAAAALPGAEMYLIPLVLNTPAARWVVGDQARTLAVLLPEFGPLIPWDAMWSACYLVLNPQSAAGQLTGATGLNAEEASGYAALVGRLLRLPLLYIEYSGRFGDPALVAAARAAAGPACRLWYGGGIRTPAQARTMAELADAVVIGNAVYDAPETLSDLVAVVGSTPGPGAQPT